MSKLAKQKAGCDMGLTGSKKGSYDPGRPGAGGATSNVADVPTRSDASFGHRSQTLNPKLVPDK